MKPEHRAKLLELAARRGDKGFSSVVTEAIASFLDRQGKREQELGEALAVRGSLTRREGEGFRKRVSRIRESWR